jgi:hypothetical protein
MTEVKLFVSRRKKCKFNALGDNVAEAPVL